MNQYQKRLKLISQQQHSFTPKIVFLDIPEGVAEVADAIAHDWPVVTDYGATYGTAFMPSIRNEVAQAREETFPLAVVSLVTFRNTAYKWMDMEMIHPSLSKLIYDGKLDVLQGISFIRYPATKECAEFVGPTSINSEAEVQTFIVPDTDPLMSCLETEHHLQFYAVRSSNITGHPEETHAPGAMAYATKIASPIFAIKNLKTFENQTTDLNLHTQDIVAGQSRQRIGSQPIMRLPNKDEAPIIKLVRAGNTSPETLRRLLKGVLVDGITFESDEEKTTSFTRKMFTVDNNIIDPLEIHQQLMQQSNLT